MPYEHILQPPLSRREFLGRVAQHFAFSTALITGSLGLGMWGYHHFERLGWTDAFLNASMLLGGMGPVEVLQTEGGKLFAGAYALYSGLVFLVSVAIILAPVLHRVMHKLHWDSQEDEA